MAKPPKRLHILYAVSWEVFCFYRVFMKKINNENKIDMRMDREGINKNLVDFFKLLLKIDMRINPENYKSLQK